MKISVHVAQGQEEVVRYTEFVLHLAVVSIVIIGVMRGCRTTWAEAHSDSGTESLHGFEANQAYAR